MGATFGWDSKADLLDYIRKMYGNPESTSVILRESLVGNHWWAAVERRTTAGDSFPYRAGDRWIEVFNLMGNGEPGWRWGYKSCPDFAGPCEVDCPLYLLELVPAVEGFASEWRERVRAYHRERNVARRSAKRAFTPGEIIELPERFKVRRFEVVSDTPLLGRADDGRVYKIPRSRVLERAESKHVTAPVQATPVPQMSFLGDVHDEPVLQRT